MVYGTLTGGKWLDSDGREYICLNTTTVGLPKGVCYVQRFWCEETRLVVYQARGCGRVVVQQVEEDMDAQLMEVAMAQVIDCWLESTGQVMT